MVFTLGNSVQVWHPIKVLLVKKKLLVLDVNVFVKQTGDLLFA